MNWGEGRTFPFIRISTKKYRWNDGVRQSVPHLDEAWEEGQVCVPRSSIQSLWELFLNRHTVTCCRCTELALESQACVGISHWTCHRFHTASFPTADTTVVCWILWSEGQSRRLALKPGTVAQPFPALGPFQSWQPSKSHGV